MGSTRSGQPQGAPSPRGGGQLEALTLLSNQQRFTQLIRKYSVVKRRDTATVNLHPFHRLPALEPLSGHAKGAGSSPSWKGCVAAPCSMELGQSEAFCVSVCWALSSAQHRDGKTLLGVTLHQSLGRPSQVPEREQYQLGLPTPFQLQGSSPELSSVPCLTSPPPHCC